MIRISTRAAAILLTGDIEAKSEAGLLGRELQLDADLLLVPHHGSRSSSTAEFIDAVAPRAALVSVGHRNRFGHPHPMVAARYAARGIALRRTDREGALRAVLPAQSGRPIVIERRVPEVRYWSDRRPQ